VEFEPRIEGGSTNLQVGPPHVEVNPSVLELIAELDSPRSADELAERLGISRSAVVKRIFSARKSGFQINLTRDGLYWKDSSARVCKRCGKELSRYNKKKTCFSCQMDK
jgi:biotin operon repressor